MIRRADPLRTARGIVLAVAAGIVMWFGLAWLAVHR